MNKDSAWACCSSTILSYFPWGHCNYCHLNINDISCTVLVNGNMSGSCCEAHQTETVDLMLWYSDIFKCPNAVYVNIWTLSNSPFLCGSLKSRNSTLRLENIFKGLLSAADLLILTDWALNFRRSRRVFVCAGSPLLRNDVLPLYFCLVFQHKFLNILNWRY